MNKNFFKNILWGVGALVLASCTADSPKTDMTNVVPEPEPIPIDYTAFPKGADVSWLTRMEAEGMEFRDSMKQETECMKLLKNECGVNSIRLRVFVSPKDGWCNDADVVVKARRATKLGMRVMIDFHFSDEWADPSNQHIPELWKDMTSADEIKAAIADHVTSTLTKLRDAGVSPAWVQIGNETRGGMIYQDADGNYLPDAISGSWNKANFTAYVNAGYDAVKAIFPDCKVIVHIDSGQTAYLYSRIYGTLKDQGGKYDLIGISLYPEVSDYKSYIDLTAENIQQAYNNYGKDVMVVEFGMPVDKPTEARDALSLLYTKAMATGHLAGIFYWEPQAPQGYNNGYDKGCFDKDGRPTIALQPFLEW